MEHTIPALVLAAILVIGGVLMAGVTNSSVDKVSQSWRDLEALSEERLGTDLAVVSTNVTGGGVDVDVVLRNDGRTSIREFSRMDIIVSYEGTDSQRYNAWLPYTESDPPSNNSWTITGISGDYHNPYIVDYGEEMTIHIRLNPATIDDPDQWIVIATETGVSYSFYF
jgi:archaellum component FlaF (FlaF/FlaG flagellin family)